MSEQLKEALRYVAVFVGSITLFVVLIALGGCSRKVYIPVESIRTDTIFQNRAEHRTDTFTRNVEIYETRYDSVAPILDSLNRVIGWDRYHFRENTKMIDTERASLLAIIDSLKNIRVDSITTIQPVEVEKVVEVAKPLKWWQKTLMVCGGVAVAYLLFISLRLNLKNG